MWFLKAFFKDKKTHRKVANTTASALGSSWDELGRTTVSRVQTAFFPAHWICGSYSPSWAAPTQVSSLLNSGYFQKQVWGHLSLRLMLGKMVSGKQDAVNFSGSAHLISSSPPHGFLRVIFLKSIRHSRKNSAFTCSSGKLSAWCTFHSNTEKRVARVSLVFT